MNWTYFIAQRIYRSSEGGNHVSKPAVRIAMAGIAIGLTVMIVSVAVVIGFKHQVRDKVIGISSDIVVSGVQGDDIYNLAPIATSDSLLAVLRKVDGVSHVQRYMLKAGMMMAGDDFQGMILKGVGQEYDWSFLQSHLVEGRVPDCTDSVASGEVLISENIARKLRLKVGDRLTTYYLENSVRARRMTITGIYNSGMSSFDDYYILSDIYTACRLHNLKPDQSGGIEIEINDFDKLDTISERVQDKLAHHTDKYGEEYYARTVEELYPQMFAWLDLLDTNVWVILILMTGVAGFTMISGLLIIILERTNLIGVLKSMGANNTAIRRIFLHFSVLLIGRGMLWGNLIGGGLCALQYYFHIFKLDPHTYYLSYVPIELNIPLYLLLNISTLIVSVLMLIGPSYLITRIHPARSIRFE